MTLGAHTSAQNTLTALRYAGSVLLVIAVIGFALISHAVQDTTPLGPGSASCSCSCSSGAATGCSCSCDTNLPLPLPVYIYRNNPTGVEVAVKTNENTILNVFDDKVYGVLNSYMGTNGELPRGEELKIQLAQQVQGNIINFITDKSDTLCPENEKFPDTETCRRGVENWTTVMKDVEDNAKRVFYNDLATLNPDILPDPLDKQVLIDMLGLVIDRNPVGNLIEAYIKKAYDSQAFHITADTQAGVVNTNTQRGNKALLFSGIQQYFMSYVQEMKDTTKFMAELGGGWFGKWECVREIVDPRTGTAKCDPNNGYSYVITPGQMNTIANTLLPTLDIEAAMNSTYFTAMYDKYARLRTDDEGEITQGLMTDQALAQGIGFMMPSSLGQEKIKPSCQIRVWPGEQIILFTSGDSTQREMTFDVYLSNTDPEYTAISLSAPTAGPVAVENPPRTVETGTPTQKTYLSTFSGLSTGTTTVTVSAAVKRENDDGTFSEGTCARNIEVTVIPNIACTIALNEAPGGTLTITNQTEAGATPIAWVDNSFFPRVRKDLNFTLGITGDAGAFDMLKLLFSSFTVQFSDTQPIHQRSFTITHPLLSPASRRALELNDLGTATISAKVQLLGMGTPLCEQTFALKAGYRCNVAACPPQRGCPTCELPDDAMVRFTEGATCKTAYCDYYSGVRTEDWQSFNAWCIDACP